MGVPPATPRRSLVVVLLAPVAVLGVAVMHALGMPGALHSSHDSPWPASETSPAMEASMDSVGSTRPAVHGSAELDGAVRPPNHGDPEPEGGPLDRGPIGHVLAMGICAFAVVMSARRVRRWSSPVGELTLGDRPPLRRLLAGPEPPVPRLSS